MGQIVDVFVVDENPEYLTPQMGYGTYWKNLNVRVFPDLSTCLNAIGNREPVVVLPEDKKTMTKEVSRYRRGLKTILLTQNNPFPNALIALMEGAYDCLDKSTFLNEIYRRRSEFAAAEVVA